MKNTIGSTYEEWIQLHEKELEGKSEEEKKAEWIKDVGKNEYN